MIELMEIVAPIIAPCIVAYVAFLKFRKDFNKDKTEAKALGINGILEANTQFRDELRGEMNRYRDERDLFKQEKEKMYEKLREMTKKCEKCHEDHKKLERKYIDLKCLFEEHNIKENQ